MNDFKSPISVGTLNASGRLCCKSRKLQGYEFFAKTRNRKRSPFRITSIALPKPPVSLTCGDEVPHIFTRKPRLQPAEFFDSQCKKTFATISDQSRQRWILARDGLSANDRYCCKKIFRIPPRNIDSKNQLVAQD